MSASAFSQRLESVTGTIADEYPVSASVDRVRWSRIDFAAHDRVDPIVALARFNLRRRMTGAGQYTPVEPFTAPSPV